MSEKIKSYFSRKCILGNARPAVSAISIILLVHIQLELSCCYGSIAKYLEMDFRYLILNVLTVGALFCVFLILCTKLWLGELAFSIIFSAIAVINYYTVSLHSLPLTIFEVKNFATAMNVIGGYTIRIDRTSGLLISVMIIEIGISLWQKKQALPYRLKNVLMRDLLLVICVSTLMYHGYLKKNSVKPHNTIGWSWQESYHTYGYAACSVEMIQSAFYIVQVPEGYSDEALGRIEIDVPKIEESTDVPDIIVILNETFYDLRQITDVETDVPYMDSFYQLDHAIRGYAVVPTRLTNASEYELLTSNSLQLMKGITPFNVIDMTGANSIVSVMEQLGYETLGAHSEPGQNYSRARAYPAMGFDEIHFEGDFTGQEFYGDRCWYETDQCLYQNLIKWYEDGTEGVPRFMYLLTIQNHAEYEMNDPKEDLVHVQNDHGAYDERMNEFLSCIKLSDLAFKELTDYFAAADRPVVICMVGDHSPTFAEYIADDAYTPYERSLRLCSTPFIIWSNREIESKDVGYVSLNYLMPMVLETAHLPRSPYYQYLLEMQKEVPVISAFDMYMDGAGNMMEYSQATEYSEMVDDYFYLEYNNLLKGHGQSLYDVHLE